MHGGDDFEVMPMCIISSITLISKFNVREVGALQEKIVRVRVEEAGLVTIKAPKTTPPNNCLILLEAVVKF